MRIRRTNCAHPSFLVLLYVRFVVAAVHNFTIDDAFGDSRTGQEVTYQPDGLWNTQTCFSCQPYPDPSHVGNQTWHAATWTSGPDLSITMSFTGSAIFVFFNVVNNPSAFASQLITTTAVNFVVDDGPAVQYQNNPTRASQFLFQAPVFTRSDLADGPHTLVISGSQNVDGGIWVNFDYAIYTHDDDLEDPPPSAPVPVPSTHASTSEPEATTSPIESSASSTTHIVLKTQGNTTSQLPVAAISTQNVTSEQSEMSTTNALATMATPFPQASSSSQSSFYTSITTKGKPLPSPSSSSSLSSSSPSSHLRREVTIALGVSIPVALLVIVFLVHRKWRQRKMDKSDKMVPYTTPHAPSRPMYASPSDHFLSTEKGKAAKEKGGIMTHPILRPRQKAIERRLKTLEQGIMNIATSLSSRETNLRNPATYGDDGEEVVSSKLRERMNIMRTQAEHLEQHRNSEWAAGLTDDIPPGYTADGISHTP